MKIDLPEIEAPPAWFAVSSASAFVGVCGIGYFWPEVAGIVAGVALLGLGVASYLKGEW
jgi:hypothetical protein